MLPYTGSDQAVITGSDEAATTGPAAEHPIGRRSQASRVDRSCTPVSPDSRETVCTRIHSGWIGFCGVVQKEHAFVYQSVVMFDDSILSHL